MSNYFVKINKAISEELFVRHQVMVDAGVSENSLKDAKKKKRNWTMDDPEDKRKNLYSYETMPGQYRDAVKMWLSKLSDGLYSNPYEYEAFQPIRSEISKDDKAEAYFTSYRYELNGKELTLNTDQIERCVRNANLLNLLVKYKNDKRVCKKKFGIDWLSFVNQVIAVIKCDNYKLPQTYRGLIVETLNKYEVQGYEAILPPRLGNQNTAKIKNDDLSKDMLLELLSHPNQYDDTYIQRAYNEWAIKRNLKKIGKATVGNKRIEYGYLITADREGWHQHNLDYAKSIQRATPSLPTYLWEGDDNHIDWWFRGDKAGEILRLKAYVVTDSYMGVNYPLGWAFTEHDITVDTIRLAFLMAMHHIQDLTGGWYLPHEVKTDRWGLKSLQKFYEGLGHYYPTPVGSKNRGWLENFFGHPDWKRSLKTNPQGNPANNYTGHNISSKSLGANLETLYNVQKAGELPHINEAGEWIAAHFERLRTIPIGYDDNAKSRQQLWLEGWATMDDSKKRPITDEQFFLKVGLRHNINGGNTITKTGIQPTIAGVQYTYSLPPAYSLPNIGRKVETLYTPFDMNTVLVTDNANMRVLAKHNTLVAGCMADMAEGGRSFLNAIIEEKKNDVLHIVKAKNDRINRLQNAGIDTESVLKLGGMARKELKTKAVEQFTQDNHLIDQPVLYNEENVEDDALLSL